MCMCISRELCCWLRFRQNWSVSATNSTLFSTHIQKAARLSFQTIYANSLYWWNGQHGQALMARTVQCTPISYSFLFGRLIIQLDFVFSNVRENGWFHHLLLEYVMCCVHVKHSVCGNKKYAINCRWWK